jgi:hypothetical protein
MIFRVNIIATIALVGGALVEQTRADEVYLCDGGRLVYVKFGELEKLKRTDACIAGYFSGKTADNARNSVAANVAVTERTNKIGIILPTRKPRHRIRKVSAWPSFTGLEILNARTASRN